MTAALEIRAVEPEIETVPVGSIKRPENLQVRAKGVNHAVVADYARAMTEGAEFPPIVCYRLKKNGPLTLADGAHRLEATIKVHGEDATIRVEVRQGSRRDALLAALASAQQFGLRFSNLDKRRAVMMMLADPKLADEKSDHELAALAGVSQPFVSKLRKVATDNGYRGEQERPAEKDPIQALLIRLKRQFADVPEADRPRLREAVSALLAEVVP